MGEWNGDIIKLKHILKEICNSLSNYGGVDKKENPKMEGIPFHCKFR